MSAIALPQGVFDQLESKRRAFLWYGKSKTTGAFYLISWEMVQKPRSKAGLGIKSLSTMNSSLLLIKLLHLVTLHGLMGGLGKTPCRRPFASLAGDVDGNH
jgi:hypothetical protein